MQTDTEMPMYRSHKIVRALKIKEIAGLMIFPEEGYAPFLVEQEYVNKHNPKAGGYYVVYADGYKSWSPAEAFESGYTRI